MTSAVVSKGNVLKCSVLILSALWTALSGRGNVGGGGNGAGTAGAVGDRQIAGGTGTAGGGGTAGGRIGGCEDSISLDFNIDTPCKRFNLLRTDLSLVSLCNVGKGSNFFRLSP